MKFMAAILFCALAVLGMPQAARADLGTVSAREIARNNNCVPAKVDVYRQTLGPEGSTMYLVSCTMPKEVDDKAPKPDSQLLINCRENLCALVRPMAGQDKK